MSDSSEPVKIIQIAVSSGADGLSSLYALTSDGRILYRSSQAWEEEYIPDLNKPSKDGRYWIDDIRNGL